MAHGIGFESTGAVYFTDTLLVIITLLLSWLSYVICHRLVIPLTTKLTERTTIEWDDILLSKTNMRKACMIAPAIVIWMFIPHIFFRLPELEMVLERITAIYITLASTKLALGLTNSLKMLDSDLQSARHQYLHTFCGVLKIAVIFLAAIAVIAILINRSPLTLLAGLGATSAILMLVFKDTISGLVAGIRLTSNDMLHKGDWITFDKAGVNGVVEEMWLTTVKVRNFDNTFVTVSPTTLVQESFQNWKGMQQSGGRRVKRMVFFDFHSIRPLDAALRQQLLDNKFFTAKELDASPAINISLFRRYMEKYLRTLPYVNHDMTLMVRQLEATNAGLPIEFYFFLKEKTWVEYEHQLADIMDAIYALTPLFGMKIYQQYPEQ